MPQSTLDVFLRSVKAKKAIQKEQTKNILPIPQLSTTEMQGVSWSLLKITGQFPKRLFSKTVKRYVGKSREKLKNEIKLKNINIASILSKAYEELPYRYPSGKEGVDYYLTVLDVSTISEDVKKWLRLQLKEEKSWNELEPKIASRIITSYVRKWLVDELGLSLRQEENETIERRIYCNGRTYKLKLKSYKEYEIRTVGYDIEAGEIIVGLRVKSGIVPLPLKDITDKQLLFHIMRILAPYIRETRTLNYPFVRVYSDTQPGSKAATVEDIIIGAPAVQRYLAKNPEDRVQLEEYFEKYYGDASIVDRVSVLLIGKYSPDGDKYCFTEFNSNLILTTAVQKRLFGRPIDTWRYKLVDDYSEAIRYFESTGKLQAVVPVKGIPVERTANLEVRLPDGVEIISRPVEVFTKGLIDKAIPANNVDDYESPLEVFVFYPEKVREYQIKRSILYSEIKRVLEGPVRYAYGDIIGLEENFIPVYNAEEYMSYVDAMNRERIKRKGHPVLGIIVLPEFSSVIADLEVRKFYNNIKGLFYDEKVPLVFQGIQAKNINPKNSNWKYVIRSVALQIGPKVGVFPYRLQRNVGYDYIIGIDYSYWREEDSVAVGGGAVLVSPNGLIEGISTYAAPSKRETLDVKKLLEYFFNELINKNEEVVQKGLTILISRDGNLPLGEQEQIKEFIQQHSEELDIRIDAVEVRKRIAVRAWSPEIANFYSPVKVGRYQYYLVSAHKGYPINSQYFAAPYLIGNFYRFEGGKETPVAKIGSASQRLVEMLISLQKISYATTNVDNVKLPLPLDAAHKLVNLIRDTNFVVRGVGIKNSMFMA